MAIRYRALHDNGAASLSLTITKPHNVGTNQLCTLITYQGIALSYAYIALILRVMHDQNIPYMQTSISKTNDSVSVNDALYSYR